MISSGGVTFDVVGNDGIVHHDGGSCVAATDDAAEQEPLADGECREIAFCFPVRDDQVDSIVLVMNQLPRLATDPVFLSLGNDARVGPAWALAHLIFRRGRRLEQPAEQAPAAISDIVTVGSVEVRVTGVIPNDKAALANALSPEGQTAGRHFDANSVAVNASVMIVNMGDGVLDLYVDLEWSLIGASGKEYVLTDVACPADENRLLGSNELCPGGNSEVNVCMVVPADEAPGVVLWIAEHFGGDGYIRMEDSSATGGSMPRGFRELPALVGRPNGEQNRP